MQRRLILLELLLATVGCAGPQPYLGMVDEQEKDSSELSEIKAREMQARESEAAENWFRSYVEMLENAETWQEITRVLDQGNDYLDQLVEWEDDQYTPLHYATEKGDLEIVKELIERRAVPVDIRTGRYQRTSSHLAALEGNLEVLEYLVEKGGDVDLRDTAIVRYLVEQKKLDAKLCLGGKYNLLFLAIEVNNMSLVKYIMEKYPEMANELAHNMNPAEFARTKHQGIMATFIDQNTPK